MEPPAEAPVEEKAVSTSDDACKSKGKGKGPRHKDLLIQLFGAQRNFGSFLTTQHSDLRHLIEMLRRGKFARLAGERLAAIEAALAADGSLFKSTTEVRSQLEVWRGQADRSFDANRYYDAERAAGYTEKMAGPQENLTRRVLQLCSLETGFPASGGVSSIADAAPTREALLALDLGCGSGLSTRAATSLSNYNVGAIGLDLSTEMLHEATWDEISDSSAPLAGERIKADLGQPLPFRKGVADLAYSVAAVHYLAQDTVRRSGNQRVGTFLSSLRGVMAPGARPCVLQAFLTKEEHAVERFLEEAPGAGWSLCQLVVDRSHETTAERDFLYLVPGGSASPPLTRSAPQTCALHRKNGQRPKACCAMSLDTWVTAEGLPWAVRLDPAHYAWLEREHGRWAKRLVRLRARCAAGEVLDHAEKPDAIAEAQAQHLVQLLSEDGPCAKGDALAEDKVGRIISVMHESSFGTQSCSS